MSIILYTDMSCVKLKRHEEASAADVGQPHGLRRGLSYTDPQSCPYSDPSPTTPRHRRGDHAAQAGPHRHRRWSLAGPRAAKRQEDRALGRRQRLASLSGSPKRPKGASQGNEVGNEIRRQGLREPARGIETWRPTRPPIAAGHDGRGSKEDLDGDLQRPGEDDQVVERRGQAAGLEP